MCKSSHQLENSFCFPTLLVETLDVPCGLAGNAPGLSEVLPQRSIVNAGSSHMLLNALFSGVELRLQTKEQFSSDHGS